MIIDLREVYGNKTIEINENIEKDENLDSRIHDLKNAHVKGYIKENSLGEIEINLDFNGTMYISDSITLQDIPYDFNTSINENLSEIEENYLNCYDFSKNTLDLKEILWQNIVLEVPISYSLSNDAEIKGNGWELLNGEKTSDEIDPRLEKLRDLLKGDD